MAFGTRLRAMMQHEVLAADVEGLLRGSGQLEDLRQQIEAKRQEGELTHPGRPWETHREMGPALALFWVSQAFIAIARNMKEADEAFDPATIGYMPRVSHDQAMALLRQVGTYLALTSAALADPTRDLRQGLPIFLQPRIEADGPCPLAHLQGMLKAAQYLDNFAQVEVDRFAAAVAIAETAPGDAKRAAQHLKGQLAEARSHLATATGAVLPILNGQPVDQPTHEEAENNLWECLSTYVVLGQLVAIPELLDQPAASSPQQPRQRGHTPPPPPRGAGPRRISRSERWCLTDPAAHQRLRAEGRLGWAQDELEELWARKDDMLTAEEQQFLAETAALQRQGAISADSYLVECPYNPVWTARRPVTILGRTLRAGSQFAYNHHGGKGGLITSFRSAPDFEECQDDD